ncbi:MAG TPA: ferrous iron transport protein A [Ignavibacteria bacterium]|nr:ferrous iron transport protein A [Ignavibacteria bacterium]HRB00250.1 ferrous iron transport protein A [Ignavibacteria bacterium]
MNYNNSEDQMKTAAEMKIGEKAIIEDIDNEHPSSHRLMEIGFTPGQEIELLNKSIFNDPISFSIRGTIIAIRKNEASSIII